MNIKRRDVSFLLPLFFVCLWGREYRGVSLSMITVTLSVVVSLVVYPSFLKHVFSPKNSIVFAMLVIYLFVNYYIGSNSGDEFDFMNYLEDIYSFGIFVFFYFLAFFYYEPFGEVRKKVNNTILAGLLLNVLVCIFMSDTELQYVYFQRLWNPYFLALIPLLALVDVNRFYTLLLFPLVIALFYFSVSFQMAVVFLFLAVIFFVPNAFMSKVNWRIFGTSIITVFVVIQSAVLMMDPLLIADIDHNFGVRVVFWREALDRFLNYPLGLGFGVTAVSGDMSLIGETAFQEGAQIVDIGVHSGVMSLLYKFGVFSLVVYLLVVKGIFGLGKTDIDNRSYVVLLFVFLLSLFSNDSIFAPHFSASLGFVLGVLNGSIAKHRIVVYCGKVRIT